MVDTTVGADLPTPEQMRAYNDVMRASWNAVRMREASRALITGNIAMGISVLGTMLILMHAQWANGIAPFLAAGLVWGYLICMLVSVRWLKRQRAESLVVVIDRREEEGRKAVARPGMYIAFLLWVAACLTGWSILFRHMSSSAILASLAIAPTLGVGYFLYRFVKFQFWEDLLFAACVALAYTPMFVSQRDLSPLSLLALLLIVVGIWSLHHRWVVWTRTLNELPGEEVPA